MFTFLTILAIIVCIFLMLFILIQNPKGGGLSSNFGASNQIMGVQKTSDFLEKATWGLSIALLVICLSMKAFSPSGKEESSSQLRERLQRNSSGLPSNFGAPSARPTSSPAAVPVSPSPKK